VNDNHDPNAVPISKENIVIKPAIDSPLVIAFIVIILLFLLFGGGAMTNGMMNDGAHGTGWMGERSWMWTPTLLTLCLGVALGWIIFKKKD
jgi:hypothetical protein